MINFSRETFRVLVSEDNERPIRDFEQIICSVIGVLRFNKVRFELRSLNGKVSFHFDVPLKLSKYVKNQIYLRYPGVEIQGSDHQLPKLKKYNLRISGVQDYNDIAPSDPIASLLSVLIEEDCCVRFTVRSNYRVSVQFLCSNRKFARKIAGSFSGICDTARLWFVMSKVRLTSTELATLFHFPDKSLDFSSIDTVDFCRIAPPSSLRGVDVVLGMTDFREACDEFGLCTEDRRRHCYVIGKTGMGKSTLLYNMIAQDISENRGVCVIDPHGDLAEAVLEAVPKSRTNDMVYFDPADFEYPVAFNLFDCGDRYQKSIVCSGLVSVFKKLYGYSWGPRLEYILRNTILALLSYSGASMLGISRMLTDKRYRSLVLRQVDDPVVSNFFVNEFERMDSRQRNEAISPVLNKVGQFLSNPIVRNIVGQSNSRLDLRTCMDKGQILVVNLSKGKLGEDVSALLGALLITKFQLDAMSRVDVPEDLRRDFYLYVDEFQNFATDSFASILSEARKFRLNLVLANQYIAQMPEQVKDAVFGNVGSLLSFQVGSDDAEYLAKQFCNDVAFKDLVSLDKYSAYVRLLINGIQSRTFSARTLAPVYISGGAEVESMRKVTRQRFANPGNLVEAKIIKWLGAV